MKISNHVWGCFKNDRFEDYITGTGNLLGYARVSTPDQDRTEQRDRLRQASVFKDVALDKESVLYYTENTLNFITHGVPMIGPIIPPL